MARLPFDPARMAGPKAPAVAPPAPPSSQISVSQLAGLIDRTVRDHIPTALKVVGEIGQARERTHHYFDLKDEGACVQCVMWASAVRKSGFAPRQGARVVCTGRVEFYPPQGKTQFMVDRIEPVGEGALDAAYRKLCDELRGLGWFDEDRKRPLPVMPRRIAVVTSAAGAALQDVRDTVARRCPCVQLCLVDVRVQGPGSAEQVAAAIGRLGRMRAEFGIDLILVTRGGGSLEDLWSFNERIVAEAIVKCPLPVVAAIGHETDTTIAELVADVRGATPTQAAMRMVPDAADLKRQVASLGQRMGQCLSRRIRLDAERLRSAARHPALADPGRIVEDKRGVLDVRTHELRHAALDRMHAIKTRLDRLEARLEPHRPDAVYRRREARLRELEGRLRTGMHEALCRHDPRGLGRRLAAGIAALVRQRSCDIDAAARSLELVGPHSVLRRGYSMTLKDDGTVVRSAASVRDGETITTRLADGSFDSTVGGKSDRVALPPAAPLRRGKKRGAVEDGPGLFA
ncbi:MAG: exodeoxyribonuclease VII large subunit [Phycisphaerales bacterium]|nr:exodeoxyribonuclease VII large subunit [Phycisphaerales bacterium]